MFARQRVVSNLRKVTPWKTGAVHQRRALSLHEHQSQDLLRQFDIPVPKGQLAKSASEVRQIMRSLGGRCIIKSQILKGGRGKGSFDTGLRGGIQIAETPEQGEKFATQMIGHRLKTKQTTGDGLVVHKVYVAETIAYDDEWYLAMTWDRENYEPVIVASRSGGVDIETTAREQPDKIYSLGFSLGKGITSDVISEVSRYFNVSPSESAALGKILERLFDLFVSKDATLLEINPFVRSSQGFTCLDAKFSFDNAAERRQKDLFAMRDVDHEVTDEVNAEKHGLVYVRMDGNIGNVVNGAGLAMATNDAIAHYGGSSANFLDAGGQATKETMLKAFDIILKDPRVRTILVNIYGGIIRCDMIAESIIAAAKELGSLPVPLVVRLQGTNAEEGLKLLESANLGLHVEADFGKAAETAVKFAKQTAESISS